MSYLFKQRLFFLSCILLLSAAVYGQHPSALLDLESTDKGFLIPRMTTAERVALPSINAPAEALLVYDETEALFYYWTNGNWEKIMNSTATLSGIKDADGDTEVLLDGVADDDLIRFRSKNVERLTIGSNIGINHSNPDAQLGFGRPGSGYPGDSIQLRLSGSYNIGVNQGSEGGTYKLRIDAYNNDAPSSVIYPIYVIDENNQEDFFLKNRPLASGDPTMYFAGNVGINKRVPLARMHIDCQNYSNDGVLVENSVVHGLVSRDNDGIGFYASSNVDDGFGSFNNSDNGFFAAFNSNSGFYAYNNDADGFYAYYNDGNGFSASSNGDGFFASSNLFSGFHATNNFHGIFAQNNGGDGIYSTGNSGDEGYFSGTVTVTGALSKGSGSFKIDHPLDPENKYLYHSFVESPDMMNVYNGNIILDGNGEAVVQMEDWFEVLNRDFRYQLTCIGGFAPVYIAEKMLNRQFKIAGGVPGMEVSWQVTGIRQDPYAEQNRIEVEVEKEEKFRGYYLHPEAYGKNFEKGFDYVKLGYKTIEEVNAMNSNEQK